MANKSVEIQIRAKDQSSAAIAKAKAGVDGLVAAEGRLSQLRQKFAAQKAVRQEIEKLADDYKRAQEAAQGYALQIEANRAAEGITAKESRLLRQKFVQARDSAKGLNAELNKQRTALHSLTNVQRGSFRASSLSTGAAVKEAAAVKKVAAAHREAAAAAANRGEVTQSSSQKNIASQIAEAAATRSGRGPLGFRPYELTNLSYQINDVVTGLATGQPVFQVFAQQAGQIFQLFQGKSLSTVVRGLASFAGGILSAAAPIGALLGVAVPFVAAIGRIRSEAASLEQFDRQLRISADGANYSAEGLTRLSIELDRLGGSLSDARSALTTFTRANVAPERLREFGESAQTAAKVLGTDIPEAAGKIAEAFTGTYEAVADLDNELNFLSLSEREHIRTMFESGEAARARNEAFLIFNETMDEGARNMGGPWERAVSNLASAWNTFIDALKNSTIINGVIGLVNGLASAVASLTDLLPGTAAPGSPESLKESSSAVLEARKVADNARKIADSYRDEDLAGRGVPGASEMQAILDQQVAEAEADLEAAQARAKRAANAIANTATAGDTINGKSQAQLKLESDEAAEEAAEAAAEAAEEAAELARKRAEQEAKFRDNLEAANDQRRFELSIADDAERAQRIKTALRNKEIEAQELGITLSQQERDEIEETVGALYDKEAAQKAALEQQKKQKGAADRDEKAALEARKALETEVNDLLSYRANLMEQISFYTDSGEGARADQLRETLADVNVDLENAAEAMLRFLRTMSGPEAESARLSMERILSETRGVGKAAIVSGREINNSIAEGGADAFGRFSEEVARGANAFDSAADAFRDFASDFLIQIARMIAQQAILNALGGGTAGASGVGGTIASAIAGIFHKGGIVTGSPAQTRALPAALFANAARFHSGGVVGLKRNEVPAVLEKNEEVLTREDPRHTLNGGQNSTGGDTKIVNVFDPAEAYAAAMQTEAGQKVLINFIKQNSRRVNSALGV